MHHVQDKYGTHVDAFSGTVMDLRAQMATVQYKEDDERQGLVMGRCRTMKLLMPMCSTASAKAQQLPRFVEVWMPRSYDDVIVPRLEFVRMLHHSALCRGAWSGSKRKTTLLRRLSEIMKAGAIVLFRYRH